MTRLHDNDIATMKLLQEELESLNARWKEARPYSQEVANLDASFKSWEKRLGRAVEAGLFQRILAAADGAGASRPIEETANRCGCNHWTKPKCPAQNCPWKGKRPVDAGVQAAPAPDVTDAMVDAYLRANDAYWKRTDELPTPPNKWRTGTPREATRESLRAALGVDLPDGAKR